MALQYEDEVRGGGPSSRKSFWHKILLEQKIVKFDIEYILYVVYFF